MRKTRYVQALALGGALVVSATFGGWGADERRGDTEPAAGEVMLGGRAAMATAVSWDLPVTRNEHVDRWIEFLAGRNSDKTELWMERSGKYGPMIRERLRARGMPEDLIYLAFIESGFSPRAYSRAHASGIWQFIEETGERYGLTVNGYVDERRDPVRATDAALSYLQYLHDDFGSWYLAAAAYNSGENRVRRILRERAGGARGDEDLFWKIAPYLPRETRDYVPLMLAAGHVGKEPQKYGFGEIDYQAPLSYDSVFVPASTALSTVARAIGVAADSVEDLNPHLLRGVTPPGDSYTVRVPDGSTVAFAQNFPRLLVQARSEAAAAERALASLTRHTARRGETLSGIARRYGVSLASVRSANRDISPSRLQVGQKVRIPRGGGLAAASSKARFYVVRRGDTLSEIAADHRVSVSTLRSINGIGRRSLIRPGQRLRVTT